MLTITEILSGSVLFDKSAIPVTEPGIELTLEQKIMLANHPNIKQQLEEQLTEQKEKVAKVAATTKQFEEIINASCHETAKAAGYGKLRFRLFINPETVEESNCIMVGGQIVHLYYSFESYTKMIEYFTNESFWKKSFIQTLVQVSKVQRNYGLIVRKSSRRSMLELTPKWKKFVYNGEEHDFNLPKDDECRTSITEIVTVTKKKVYADGTVLTAIAGGDAKYRKEYEREAMIDLGQQIKMRMLERESLEVEKVEDDRS